MRRIMQAESKRRSRAYESECVFLGEHVALDCRWKCLCNRTDDGAFDDLYDIDG